MVLKEVANENPIRLQRRLPGQRDSVPLYICDPEIMIFLWDCKGVHKHTHTHSKQSNSATQFTWLLLDFPFSSCESIHSMLFFHNLTSLWGFEVDGMTAWAVAPPVEGHDDEAVLGEGRQNWYRGVVLIPGDCQRVFISGTFL